MTNRNEDKNPRQEDNNASYNPTERNFDQTDVSGEPEKMGGNTGGPAGREEDMNDDDPALTKVDLEEDNLTVEEADQKERDEPGTGEREGAWRAREQKGP